MKSSHDKSTTQAEKEEEAAEPLEGFRINMDYADEGEARTYMEWYEQYNKPSSIEEPKPYVILEARKKGKKGNDKEKEEKEKEKE
ncbi:hypothetical protein Pmani_032633 [Petrolisthes manimaculis]|nr:hypothetical protein Pmani_032633 [Petrolisthes manimaculis]